MDWFVMTAAMNSYIKIFLVLCFSPCLAANGLSDPTRPADFYTGTINIEYIPEETAEWSLKAIRITSDTRIAIINNKIVKEGDSIGPASVLEIKHGSVVLDYDRQRLEVMLIRADIKKVAIDHN